VSWLDERKLRRVIDDIIKRGSSVSAGTFRWLHRWAKVDPERRCWELNMELALRSSKWRYEYGGTVVIGLLSYPGAIVRAKEEKP
jgi:hypothetical protein